MVDISELEFKELSKICIFRVSPLRVSERMTFNELGGEEVVFTPSMRLFYGQHVYKDEEGKYVSFAMEGRKPCFITESQLEKFLKLENNIYAYIRAGSAYAALVTSKCRLLMPGLPRFQAYRGDYVVRLQDGVHVYVDRQIFKSMFVTRDML